MFRENGDQEQRRADAELGQVLKIDGADPLTVNVNPIRGVQVAQPDRVLFYCDSAVQARHCGVIDFDIRTAATAT